MTFKVEYSGLQGSEILHMRAIKPWSHWDSALTVAYFGAAAAVMLTLGADMTNIVSNGLAEGVTTTQKAQQALGVGALIMAAQEGWNAYLRMSQTIESTGRQIEKLPHISNPELDAVKEDIEKVMGKHGDMRKIRFVDKAEMEEILGVHDAGVSPMACTNPSYSKTHISIGVNPAFAASRDVTMHLVLAGHEVSHHYGPAHLHALSRGLLAANIPVVFGEIMCGVVFGGASHALLALGAFFAVPALLQTHYRRQEFRSDRGAAFFTGDAGMVRGVLENMDAHTARFSPLQSQASQNTWQDKIGNVMWRVAQKGLGTLMDSHPPTQNRIRAMDVLTKQQAYARQNLG